MATANDHGEQAGSASPSPASSAGGSTSTGDGAEDHLLAEAAGDETNTQLNLGGAYGHRVEVTLVPDFPDGDPRNIPPPNGTLTPYRVVFVLHRPGVPLSGEYEFSMAPDREGNSHLILRAPAAMIRVDHVDETNRPGTFTVHPNKSGFLGRVEAQLDATSFDDALQAAYSGMASILSSWSLHLDVPLRVFQVICTQEATARTITSVVVPFPERPLVVRTRSHSTRELRAHASLYREALNSNSAPYQYLCLYKIIEGIRLRRVHVRNSPARTNRDAVRASEVVPRTEEEFVPWLNRLYYVRPIWQTADFKTLFPPPVRRWKFGRIVDETLLPLRDSVAHALTEKGAVRLSVDEFLHTRAVEAWLPLTKLMARRMLKNEFPDEFLADLGEDGNIVKRAEPAFSDTAPTGPISVTQEND
jgi:hypothetical protein